MASAGRATDSVDFGAFLQSIRARRHPNVILTFEDGRILTRSQSQLCEDAAAAAARLRGWGVRAGMRVGIRAPNSYQWLVYDLALLEAGATSVAFTDDFAGEKVTSLTQRYQLSLLLLPAAERPSGVSPPPGVAYIDSDTECVRLWPRAVGERTAPWLVFSSGSAGGAKGLVIEPRGVAQTIDTLVRAIGPRSDDRIAIFLPLSNFQQRMMCYAALWHGFDIVLVSVGRLFHALREMHPTILVAPPVLYETVAGRVLNQTLPKRLVLSTALAVRDVVPQSARRRLVRRLFRGVHETFGGRMRFMITGMAPISRATLDLFATMDLPLFEAYGLVETGPIALNVPGASRLGSVGRPFPGVSIQLAPDGEIVVERRHHLARGYFEAAEGECERTFLGAGRVATGDIGRFDQDGFLYLVGRKKEIIVTPGGDKIHPEVVEAALSECPDVACAVIIGHDGAGLSAVVRPARPGNAPMHRRIRRFTEELGQRQPKFTISALTFTDIEFSRENGCLRPNLKLDRRCIAQRFAADAAGMPNNTAALHGAER
jgi:long-chain acyl-CoA synthetase